MEPVSSKIQNVPLTQPVGSVSSISNIRAHQNNPPTDVVSFSGNKYSKTPEQVNQITHDAKVTAAGWSAFGLILSTLYFGIRSPKEVAKKYNLDETQDKKLIKNIKDTQIMATLPAVVGLGILPWLYFKFGEDPQNQTILSPKK